MVKSNAPVVQSLWRRHWLWALFLVAVTVLAYYRMWQAGFIWDDAEHLTQNPCIIGPLGFKDIWTSSQAYYYPLVLTSFWVIHKFLDLNPLPYHLLNVLMHAGSAVLLWGVLRRLGVCAALFGAGLWALHPVMVQSVAWITELKNTQSCFFYLLSILFFLNADGHKAKPQRRWRFGLSLLFFLMAITSKSAVVMLPVVLVLCLWWRNGRLLWRDLVVLVPFFLISAAASGWTIWEQQFHSGAIGAEFAQTWPQRLVIAGRDIWFYLSKLFWPDPLIFIYPRWKIDTTKLVTFLPLAAAVGGLLLLWWKRNGPLRPVFVAAAYFVLSLFPVLGFFNVYFFRYSFVSDHFQYLAAMGPLALVASGIASLGRGSFGKTRLWLQPAFGAAPLFILGVLTWQQTKNYADPETLYQTTIARNPDCWLAYNNLGAMSVQQRRLDEAIGYYEKALIIEPEIPEAQYNLGNAFFTKNDFARAIGAYQLALRARPDNTKARNNLAVCLIATGDSNQAIEQFGEALRFNPNDPDTHYNLGYLLVQLGRREEAVSHLTEAVRLKPDYAQAKEQLRALGVLVPPF
jgi:tetratricopeptide (TPR) repeat protein